MKAPMRSRIEKMALWTEKMNNAQHAAGRFIVFIGMLWLFTDFWLGLGCLTVGLLFWWNAAHDRRKWEDHGGVVRYYLLNVRKEVDDGEEDEAGPSPREG